MSMVPGLAHYNTEVGIQTLANKLSTSIFNRWRKKGCEYEEINDGEYPPFEFFEHLWVAKQNGQITQLTFKDAPMKDQV